MVSASTVTTLAVIAIPHVLYAFIWFFPKKYTRVCKTFTKTDALTVFANVAVLMKGERLLTLCVAICSLCALTAFFLQSCSSQQSISGTPHRGLCR